MVKRYDPKLIVHKFGNISILYRDQKYEVWKDDKFCQTYDSYSDACFSILEDLI